MSITVSHQLRDGAHKHYKYDEINGIPINNYMKDKMRQNRQRMREERGLPPPPKKAADLDQSIRDEIKDLKQKKWRVTDISTKLGVSIHLVKKVLQQNETNF